MKRFLVLAALLLAIVTASRSNQPATTWRNSLHPRGKPGRELELVTNGQPKYAIALTEKPTPQETFAADNLRHWVKEITGGEMSFVTTKPAGPFVRIATDKKFADEEYRIGVDEWFNLELTGGTGRGVVNAVYALLEEDIGCRWYTRDDTRLPKRPTLRVAPVPRQYAPPLALRDPFYWCAHDAAWSLHNRTNAPSAVVPEEAGGHVDYGGLFVHTAANLLPPDKYFKDHPEYFAMNAAGQRYPAQLCSTDPDVAKIVTENVLAVLDKNPHTEIVSVSKNDNAGDQICHCPVCSKLRADEGGTDMGPQLVLVNHVAEAVEKRHPKVIVDTIAYLETSGVPKTIRPRKNVAIRLCNAMVGAWPHPFTPAEQCEVAKLAEAWAKVHDRMSIWDYNVNFGHYLAPMPNLDVMAANIRFWIKNKAFGVMLQGGYQSPAERDELKSWVCAKLMWDPRLNEQELIDDFIVGHYGPAAPAIAEYERLLAQTAKDHASTMASPPSGIRYPMDAPFLSKEFLDKVAEVFARAEKLAGDDAVTLRKVERAELPILYVKVVRGPAFVGKDYPAVLDRFGRIARQEKVQFLEEGGADFDAKMAAWRKR
jgi:hypothetical protein